MSREYQFSIEFTVTDEQALLAAAVASLMRDGYTEKEARAEFVDDEYGLDIGKCAQQLLDPGVSPDGIEIQNSSCE